MIALLSWQARAVVALVIALALAGTHWKAYTAGAKGVQAEWGAEKLTQAAQTLQLMADAQAATARLQAKADTQRRTKNAQIARLNADLSTALAGLSDRPARDSAGSVPAHATPGDPAPGCTGAQLYRDDSEFLARLAADADQLRIGLQACYAGYEAARAALAISDAR